MACTTPSPSSNLKPPRPVQRRSILILSGLALGIAATVGWAFEIPLLDGTVDVSELLADGVTIGASLGLAVGIVLATAARSKLGKFQTVASTILLSTALVTLLAHVTNRTLGDLEAQTVELKVKEVTKTWSGRGLSREVLDGPPDGYYIFFETPDGLIRLLQPGGEAPEITASRRLPVVVNQGFWGYPRYSLPDA